MVVRRLEDDCGMDLRASGFPAYLTDSEPEQAGAEVVVRGRDEAPGGAEK
jgi:3-hydroxyisobutyrate dehydrogenase